MSSSSSALTLALDQPESGPSSSSIKTPNKKTRKSQTGRTCGSPTPIHKPSKKDTVDQLRTGLATLGLDTKGKKETLWRRLVRAFNHIGLSSPPKEEAATKLEETEDARLDQRYKYFLCFDVEATCRGGKEFNWPNEIIEFPVVLCRYDQGQGKLERIDTFHSYVRPTWSPILTEFCISLTGILQEKVDEAPTFLEVLKMFEEWLEKHQLLDQDRNLRDALWVTDGPWDLRDFVPKQLHITPLSSSPYPPYFLGPYLNLKAAVHAVLSEQWRRKQYALEHPNAPPNSRALSRITTASTMNRKQRDENSKRSGKSFWLGITGMVEALGLGDFEGRAHSGIDDATNLSRILIELVERGVQIEPNGRLYKPGKKWAWQGEPGEVIFEEWMSDRTAKEKLMYGPSEGTAVDQSPPSSVEERVNVNVGEEVKVGEEVIVGEEIKTDEVTAEKAAAIGEGVEAGEEAKVGLESGDKPETFAHQPNATAGPTMAKTDVEVAGQKLEDLKLGENSVEKGVENGEEGGDTTH